MTSTSHAFERNFRWIVLCGSILSVALMAAARPSGDDDAVHYSMMRVKPRVSSHLPPQLMDRLQPVGYRVSSKGEGEEETMCEVFWAKTVRTEEVPLSESGVRYGQIRQGSLIGVIHFLIIQRYVRDYRSQMLRPGYYTMRYAVMPKGSNENEPRDFVLLVPVNADRDPATTLPVAKLVHLSRLSSTVKQPVALSLMAVDRDERLPGLITDDEGTSTLQVKLRAAAKQGQAGKDVPIALVVITAIPEDLGD